MARLRATKIEVAYDRHRKAWVVRPFLRGGKALRRPLERLRDFRVQVFAAYPNTPPPLGEPSAREQAVATGRKLGRAFADNPRGKPCELYLRLMDGTIGARETYGRDPIESKG